MILSFEGVVFCDGGEGWAAAGDGCSSFNANGMAEFLWSMAWTDASSLQPFAGECGVAEQQRGDDLKNGEGVWRFRRLGKSSEVLPMK